MNVSDIPIVQVTEQYLAYLRAMESLNLVIAGEFFVIAATLIEIKSRSLLPRPPKVDLDSGDDEIDPKEELVQRLLDYQRYKSLVATLSDWESSRRRLYFRGQADYGEQYELPIGFGTLSPTVLSNALMRLFEEAGQNDEQEITAVRRQKLTLRLSMIALWHKVRNAGIEGIDFSHCIPRPLVRLEIVMLFLGLLELLRQSKVSAIQIALLDEIRVTAITEREVEIKEAVPTYA